MTCHLKAKRRFFNSYQRENASDKIEVTLGIVMVRASRKESGSRVIIRDVNGFLRHRDMDYLSPARIFLNDLGFLLGDCNRCNCIVINPELLRIDSQVEFLKKVFLKNFVCNVCRVDRRRPAVASLMLATSVGSGKVDQWFP